MIEYKLNSHLIKISNPEKIYFPEDKISKKDLIDYYIKISDKFLPFTKNRCLTMQRYPDGIHGEGFFQKDAAKYFPQWIKTLPIEKKSEQGVTNYVVCNNVATLAYIAGQGCITSHIWVTKIDKLEYPDQLIFDLDPYDDDFQTAIDTALKLKEIFDALKLKAYVMTTGSNGLHVRLPIIRKFDNTQVRLFAERISLLLINENPDKLTLEISKNKRGKRLFIDTLRNSYSATAVAPYCVRPKPGAPIATPIFWEELKNKKISSQFCNIKNIFERISKIDDPWEDFFSVRQSLPAHILRLASLAQDER